MRQIRSSNAVGNEQYYRPATPPHPPGSEQYYRPATPPPYPPRSEQFYGPVTPAPQVQPQQGRRAAANAAKAQVRQRISSYKRRIVAVAFTSFGAIALLTGFSIHQSANSSTSSGSSNASSSSDSENDSSSNFFNQGGSSNVGSSSQQPGSGTTNS